MMAANTAQSVTSNGYGVMAMVAASRVKITAHAIRMQMKIIIGIRNDDTILNIFFVMGSVTGVVKINVHDTLRDQWTVVCTQLFLSAKDGFPFILLDTITDELRAKLESEDLHIHQEFEWHMVQLDEEKHPRLYGYVDKHTLERIAEKQCTDASQLITMRRNCSESLQRKLRDAGYIITDVNTVLIKIAW